MPTINTSTSPQNHTSTPPPHLIQYPTPPPHCTSLFSSTAPCRKEHFPYNTWYMYRHMYTIHDTALLQQQGCSHRHSRSCFHLVQDKTSWQLVTENILLQAPLLYDVTSTWFMSLSEVTWHLNTYVHTVCDNITLSYCFYETKQPFPL